MWPTSSGKPMPTMSQMLVNRSSEVGSLGQKRVRAVKSNDAKGGAERLVSGTSNGRVLSAHAASTRLANERGSGTCNAGGRKSRLISACASGHLGNSSAENGAKSLVVKSVVLSTGATICPVPMPAHYFQSSLGAQAREHLLMLVTWPACGKGHVSQSAIQQLASFNFQTSLPAG